MTEREREYDKDIHEKQIEIYSLICVKLWGTNIQYQHQS